MLTLLDITSEGMISTAKLVSVGQLYSWYTDTGKQQIHYTIEALFQNGKDNFFIRQYEPQRHD